MIVKTREQVLLETEVTLTKNDLLEFLNLKGITFPSGASLTLTLGEADTYQWGDEDDLLLVVSHKRSVAR